eukprot:scaffold285936_cov22-Tisochrysis_lutea.AAC.1
MEAARDIEFGCPSMHVALVLVMNGYAVHLLLQYAHADQFPGAFSFYVLEMVQAAAMAWVGVIAWGRLYLGVHSPVDLGLGAVVGMVRMLWVFMHHLRVNHHLHWVPINSLMVPVQWVSMHHMGRVYCACHTTIDRIS